jgi:hypothetical protein
LLFEATTLQISGPAVSQKELEKLMATDLKTEGKFNSDDLKKMKARIEMIGEFDDVKAVMDLVKKLGGTGE